MDSKNIDDAITVRRYSCTVLNECPGNNRLLIAEICSIFLYFHAGFWLNYKFKQHQEHVGVLALNLAITSDQTKAC